MSGIKYALPHVYLLLPLFELCLLSLGLLPVLVGNLGHDPLVGLLPPLLFLDESLVLLLHPFVHLGLPLSDEALLEPVLELHVALLLPLLLRQFLLFFLLQFE